jgi:uncharacterized ferritin-like protein (DUF455 family)
VTDISFAIAEALAAPDPPSRVRLTRALARAWRRGELSFAFTHPMADRPAEPARPILLRPGDMPKRRRGGSDAGRIAMLHALAHIEYVAIALALDAAGRFGAEFPRDFTSDWLAVAADEAMHFVLLDRRLRQLGSHYGALPAHDGLWGVAQATKEEPLARLALVPMVLEARGLDVTPATVARFTAQGDTASARILDRIYRDEIRHVAVGTRWYEWMCERQGLMPQNHWKALVNARLKGALKPPFNNSARSTAGLTQDYYAGVA